MVIFLGHVKLFQNCMDLTWLRIHLSYGNLLSLAAFSFVLFICLYLFKKFYFCKLQVVSVPPYPLLPICISGGIFWNSRSFPKTRVRPFSFSFWTLIPEVGVVVREYFWMLCLKIVLNVEVVLCLLSWFFFFFSAWSTVLYYALNLAGVGDCLWSNFGIMVFLMHVPWTTVTLFLKDAKIRIPIPKIRRKTILFPILAVPGFGPWQSTKVIGTSGHCHWVVPSGTE